MKTSFNLVILSFVERKMKWSDAQDYCKADGGKLVEIDSEEENIALVEEIKKKGLTKWNFWMGLTDSESEGDWRLESSGLTTSYTNWGGDEPNSYKGWNEDCAQLDFNFLPEQWKPENNGKWIDVICEKKNFFRFLVQFFVFALVKWQTAASQS